MTPTYPGESDGAASRPYSLAVEIPLELVRMAMRSVADMVVVPLQDLFGLGGEARMNRPAVAEGNWRWRMDASLLTPELEEVLREMTAIYGRLPADTPH